MTKRKIIALAVVTGVLAAVVPVWLVRPGRAFSPPLTQPASGWVDRFTVLIRGMLEPRRGQCRSTIFIDHTEDAPGERSPVAAVRAFGGGTLDLRVQPVAPDEAIVEGFDGSVKIAAFEVFRTQIGGWVVVRADSLRECE